MALGLRAPVADLALYVVLPTPRVVAVLWLSCFELESKEHLVSDDSDDEDEGEQEEAGEEGEDEADV